MLVRPLLVADAPSFQLLCLAGLKESPASFASSYEEEVDWLADRIEGQLVRSDDHCVFGAFEGARLVAIAGFRRENMRNLSHKAFLWGVYVTPDMRGQGAGRTLVTEVIAFARAAAGITQVNLTVNADNDAAVLLYTSVGFKQFGLETGAMVVDGR